MSIDREDGDRPHFESRLLLDDDRINTRPEPSLLRRYLSPFLIFLAGLFLGGLLTSSLSSPSSRPGKSRSSTSTPNLAIITRVYHGAAIEAYTMLLASYSIWFPSTAWTNTEMALVWDDESLRDRQMATVLAQLPPHPLMHFEPAPPAGTLCSDWRSEGYARQQYSNFLCDPLVPDRGRS